jgi:hypothetical protein
MLERCSGMVNSQELPEQRSGVQKMSSSVGFHTNKNPEFSMAEKFGIVNRLFLRSVFV